MERSTIFRFNVCLLLFVFSLGLTGDVRIAAQDKPNFIFILADDMGYADLGADASGIDTPYLDQLARDGLKFTRFYAQSCICSPTRAAFLTGRYPHAVGVPELANRDLHLDLNAVTIPEALKPLGYRSMLAGKWHLGYHQPYWPRQHGFDEFWGSLVGTPKYYHPEETYHNETKITVDGYFTDRITDNAVRFIRENRSRPFFLYLAYNAPHFPLEAPQPGHVMDGASMRPLLRGEDQDVHEILHWDVRRMYVVMKGKWKLVRDFEVKHPELYNLDDDITESRNLTDRYPMITKELVDLHDNW